MCVLTCGEVATSCTTSLSSGFCLEGESHGECVIAWCVVNILLIEVVVLERLNPRPVVLSVQTKPRVRL